MEQETMKKEVERVMALPLSEIADWAHSLVVRRAASRGLEVPLGPHETKRMLALLLLHCEVSVGDVDDVVSSWSALQIFAGGSAAVRVFPHVSDDHFIPNTHDAVVRDGRLRPCVESLLRVLY